MTIKSVAQTLTYLNGEYLWLREVIFFFVCTSAYIKSTFGASGNKFNLANKLSNNEYFWFIHNSER